MQRLPTIIERTRSCQIIGMALFCLMLVTTGCRNLGKPDNQYDLIAAELRTREQELRETRAALAHARLLNQTYQQQLHVPYSTMPVYRTDPDTPGYPVETMTLGSGTGGVDDDFEPGDETFMVVVDPKDLDGTTLKVPGKVSVIAFEVTTAGLKMPIGRWEVSPEQLHQAWRDGLLAKGFFIPLQWDKLPATGQVRVVARLQTLDGRVFEADKTFNPQPVIGAGRRGLIVPGEDLHMPGAMLQFPENVSPRRASGAPE